MTTYVPGYQDDGKTPNDYHTTTPHYFTFRRLKAGEVTRMLVCVVCDRPHPHNARCRCHLGQDR